jgi:hypothetical protein
VVYTFSNFLSVIFSGVLRNCSKLIYYSLNGFNMSRPLLITTCTDRKTLAPPRSLQVRHLPGRSIEGRSTEWINRISKVGTAKVPAFHLYAGEHWSLTKDCAPYVSGICVISTGYGLISSESLVSGYGATFTPGQVDSIGNDLQDSQDWWRNINEWEGPMGRRTPISRLAKKSTVLIAASATYLNVIRPELEKIDPSSLIIISGGSAPSVLPDHRIVVSERLLTSLGGSMVSLNIRVAQYLLSEAPKSGLTRRWAEKKILDLDSRSTDRVKYSRTKLTDKQVVTEIRKMLKLDPRITISRAHRALRDSGLACEQTRFRDLFREYVGYQK